MIGWIKISGSTPSAPMLITVTDGLYLSVRGYDNHIYYRKYNGVSWETWETIPGRAIDTPALTMVGDNLYFAVNGQTGYLYFSSLDVGTSTFSGWSTLPGTSPSSPALTNDGTDVYLSVRGSNSGVYINSYDGSWGSWVSLPDNTIDVIGSTYYDGNIHLVVRRSSLYSDYEVYYGTIDPTLSVFSGWDLISSSALNTPVLVSPKP